MESGLLASLDLGPLALALVVLGAVLWALVLFLRQNRKDLDVLEEELESAEAEDEESADEQEAGGRP